MTIAYYLKKCKGSLEAEILFATRSGKDYIGALVAGAHVTVTPDFDLWGTDPGNMFTIEYVTVNDILDEIQVFVY